MELPADIARRIEELFLDSERREAATLVLGAKLHDGSFAGPRCQRCAVVASNGSLQRLAYYVNLLAVDFRDVIVAGEYVPHGGKLVRVRNLNEPFSEAEA